MSKYYITKLRVEKLWGHRKPLEIRFNSDMNIVIGPNASGKTTIINILHQSLTGNLSALANIEFKKIVVGLRSFSESESVELRIEQFDGMIQACLGNLEVSMPVMPLRLKGELGSEEFYVIPSSRKDLQRELFGFKELIRGMVPAVWLPVSRRLPIMDEEEAERRRLHRRPLESVDECLNGLLDMLRAYRISLDSRMSELRKEFQKHALETILYDKQHDQLRDFSDFTPASDTEKQQLLKAFSDVGFLDSRITKRVEEHFRAADQAAEKMKRDERHFDIETLFIIPLMNRTKSMVKFAQELEEKRTRLFAAVHSFETTVTKFLSPKTVTVSKEGQLVVASSQPKSAELDWRQLSSGEKQILILLTQALLSEKEPVVYVADEPELSLHVIWQEMLMQSLSSLAGRCQFIVATHSPDIAGGFPDKLIDLARQ